ncbi:MAG: hypothetical protein O7F76_07950 [Planctomycetota bacterium]|nr:hypothetical protein [Planctomycetota bacterium]
MTDKKDLVALVADKNMESALAGLLGRHLAFGTREIRWEIYVHPERDPGCLRKSHTFLRSQSSNFEHALVMFDREGSGREARQATELEAEVERALSTNGWDDRAAALVLDPELEVWVWSDSPEVDQVLGWAGREPDLRAWLHDNDEVWPKTSSNRRTGKPERPKEAMEQALKLVNRPRSSAYYSTLARTISVERCTDRTFLKTRDCLRRWFGQSA